MKITAVVCFCVVVFAGLSADAVSGRTPTATPTASLAPTSSTPTASPRDVSTFGGTCWLDARPCTGEIGARINGVACGEQLPTITAPDSNVPFYALRVLSDQYRAGCGREGAVITFFLDGQQAAQTAIWHAGGSEHLTLIAGPSFARFGGGLSIERNPVKQMVGPFIGGQLCGRDITLGLLGSSTLHDTVVFSAEQQAGCGVEGSIITFKLLDAQGNVIGVANQTADWHAWDGISDPQRLDLTFGPGTVITMPGTGTGDGLRRDASAFAALAIALSGIGLVGVATAAALRKKTPTR